MESSTAIKLPDHAFQNMDSSHYNHMKILHICSWYPNRIEKNDGNFIFRHIRSTVNEGNSYAITVYEDNNLTKKSSEVIESDNDGVKSMVIYYSPTCFKFTKLIKKFYYYIKAYRLYCKKFGKPNLIHAHVLLYAGITAWLLCYVTGIPYILTEHSSIYQTRKLNYFLLKVLKSVSLRSSALLPVSISLSKRMKELGIIGNYIVINNVVDTELYRPIEKQDKNRKIRILHISNFSEAKNMSGIIKVISKLGVIRQDFLFTIAGDGNLTRVEDQIMNEEIDKGLIDLKGEMTEKEVAELMQNNDIFMLFSNYENLPCVLLEAQACGMPIAASEVGGIKEIVSGSKFGILVQSGDVDSMVLALSTMIDNYSSYDTQAIAKKAVLEYSNGAIGQKLSRIYSVYAS